MLRAICLLATICNQMLYVIAAANTNPPADMHYQKPCKKAEQVKNILKVYF